MMLTTLAGFWKGVTALLLIAAMFALAVVFYFRYFLSHRKFRRDDTFQCPYCGTVFTLPHFQPSIHLIRQRLVRCPSCGKTFWQRWM
ncbi:MJ0042-type zinc finger domain-containing protein [Ethanoligenens harbinense]|uniref:MJ0042-type zinc finger domain-containing protein n=1 Tax=Ethanoligenens harbinense TaxID=253239 RepID=UPI0001C52155|nr:MJ0042-type zinc finger domain-containing protein [Ethanoligenens harbinense]AVQ96331.1 hypothetical protein CXQ68_08925 [Ethanoligenens harbinense YUAN-3]AYF38989.1 hypothetical protein CXP51_08795 [Ethanoligenens harbinense]AYF41742.1 hypothetical protein CN246_08945 [Ethanoligenens harbinense]QCN92572.1 hypothetical protein DRA42_08955 [Ethanoligenens harbinense]